MTLERQANHEDGADDEQVAVEMSLEASRCRYFFKETDQDPKRTTRLDPVGDVSVSSPQHQHQRGVVVTVSLAQERRPRA